MLSDIHSAEKLQVDMFGHSDFVAGSQVMDIMDSINATCGKKALN